MQWNAYIKNVLNLDFLLLLSKTRVITASYYYLSEKEHLVYSSFDGSI